MNAFLPCSVGIIRILKTEVHICKYTVDMQLATGPQWVSITGMQHLLRQYIQTIYYEDFLKANCDAGSSFNCLVAR